MDFLHKREYLHSGDEVVVNCSHQCNVMLLSDMEFNNYKHGRKYKYYGGHFTYLPAHILAPHTGYWNIVLDLGGGSATITHSFQIIRHNQ